MKCQKLEISKLMNLKRRKQTRLETLLPLSCDYQAKNLHCCLNLLPAAADWVNVENDGTVLFTLIKRRRL